MEATQVRRDPFARASLMRLVVPKEDRQSCHWCDRPGRFRYAWEGDARCLSERDFGRMSFCSVECFESYHD